MKLYRFAPEGGNLDALPPADRMVSVTETLTKVQLSKRAATLTALSLVFVAAFGEAVTEAAATFTVIYVLAIFIAVSFAGRRTGQAVAITAVVTAFLANAIAHPTLGLSFLIWNACLDLVLFVFFVEVVWALEHRLRYEVLARKDGVGTLRHAERLGTLGRLASGIAHEIGTPLNVISGRAELIASGDLSKEEMVASAKIVMSQAERVTYIIRQLLDFARRGGTRVERTDLAVVAEDTANLLRPLASKLGVEIVCNGGSARATVNAGEIQQVITNLLTNAIYALPNGGKVDLTATTEVERDPRHPNAPPRLHAVVSVRDNGTGIAPDVLPRIFEPFFTTRDVGVGTGLGLSVAYGIVQDHGGWMSVDTELGQGTNIAFHLPG